MGGNRSQAKPFKVKAAKSAHAYAFREAAKTFPLTALDARRIEKFVSSLPKTSSVSRFPSDPIALPRPQAARAAKTTTRRKLAKRPRKAQARKSAKVLHRPHDKRRLNLLRARLKRAALLRKLQAAAKDKPAASA